MPRPRSGGAPRTSAAIKPRTSRQPSKRWTALSAPRRGCKPSANARSCAVMSSSTSSEDAPPPPSPPPPPASAAADRFSRGTCACRTSWSRSRSASAVPFPAGNGRRAPLKRALHDRLVRDHPALVLHEVRLGLRRGQRWERPRRRERLVPGHRLDPPCKDETRIAGAAPAAGIFAGQADEGVGVDEEQAAHGPRQGRGGPWRRLEGRQGGQGLCPSRL